MGDDGQAETPLHMFTVCLPRSHDPKRHVLPFSSVMDIEESC
jgi:hypothetical protein